MVPPVDSLHAVSTQDRSVVHFNDCTDDRSSDIGQNDEFLPSSSIIGEGFSTYSKPIVVLDFIWNLSFIVVAVIVLLSTFKERPSTPLRVWIVGYAFQCLLHVACVYIEYRKRNYGFPYLRTITQSRMLKRLESANTIVSSIWWVFGFYWIVVGGQALLQDSPRLYWLTVIFLAFDVFFVIFCVGMACVVFLALFCCIPILAIAYAVAPTEGASPDTIRSLPKFRYCAASSQGIFDDSEKQGVVRASCRLSNNVSCEDGSCDDLSLCADDAECCICLSSYVIGVELCMLPCNHHFHSTCISKWLMINATCPLCKFNILRRDTLV